MTLDANDWLKGDCQKWIISLERWVRDETAEFIE